MLNFDEELEKFKPSMEVDDIEEALYKEDLTGTGIGESVRESDETEGRQDR